MTVEETAGSLKTHEERLKGQVVSGGSQLLFTMEEWLERERYESKLLLTKEEWLRRFQRGGNEVKVQGPRKEFNRGLRDKSKVH